MNLLLEKTLPTILQELEVVYAVRPGQLKTGMLKFDAAVFLAQALLYVAGSSPSVDDYSTVSIASDVSVLINKMKDEGQLGGHGPDDPPLLKFNPTTGERLVPEDEEILGKKTTGEEFGSEYDKQLFKDNEAIRDLERKQADTPRYKLPDHLKVKNPSENLGYEPPVAEI
jgi:hypothetical protein